MINLLLMTSLVALLSGCGGVGVDEKPLNNESFEEVRESDIQDAIEDLVQSEYKHKEMKNDPNLLEKIEISRSRTVKVSYEYSKSDTVGDYKCIMIYNGKIDNVEEDPHSTRNDYRIGDIPAKLVNAIGAIYVVGFDLFEVNTNFSSLSSDRTLECENAVLGFRPSIFPKKYLKNGLRYSILVYPDYTYDDMKIVLQ